MLTFVRTRWFFHSRPVRSWFLLFVLAAVAVGTWHQAWNQARQSARQWGATTAVVVVRDPVAIGSPVDGALVVELRPTAHLPLTVLAELPPPGWVAARDLDPGVVVAETDVIGATGSPTRPGPGEVALAIPLGAAVPPLQPGDSVSLVATGRFDGPAHVPMVIDRARVLAVGDTSVLVALPDDQLTRAADAVQQGSLTVALSASLPPTPRG